MVSVLHNTRARSKIFSSEHEKVAILEALKKSSGNKLLAAQLLGVSLRTLRYRLKKLGLDAH